MAYASCRHVAVALGSLIVSTVSQSHSAPLNPSSKSRPLMGSLPHRISAGIFPGAFGVSTFSPISSDRGFRRRGAAGGGRTRDFKIFSSLPLAPARASAASPAAGRRRLSFLYMTLDSSPRHGHGRGHGRDRGLRLPRTCRARVMSNRPQAGDISCNDPDKPLVSTTRRGILERAVTVAFGLGAVGLPGWGLRPAWAAEREELLEEEYSSPDGSFALRYPANFKAFSKPLKTHKVEVNFKSDEVKGYEIGVAVDPVKIESLDKFGTPEEVGARVLKVEQGKDGTLDTKMIRTTAEKQGDLSLYTLDYFVESTRGFKHFVAKVAIKDNLLYACTGQAREIDFPAVESQLKRMVDSFRVPA